MARKPKTSPESLLARLFEEERDRGEARPFTLPGGATLYETGEAADRLFFLRAGRRLHAGTGPRSL